MTRQGAARAAATGVRIAVGAIVAVACAGAAVVGVHAPWPEVAHEPAQVRVTPVPGNTQLVCDGSFRALGRDASQAQLMTSAGLPRLVSGGTEGEPSADGLEMPGLAGGSGARTLTGTVQGRTAPLIAAVESIVLDAEDLSGLAAAPCRAPALQTWLVGGSAATGSADVIVLSNPSDVASTVTFAVFGSKRAASTAVVPPKTQTALPLASIAPGESTPVVQVVASGAPVRAVLQSSYVRVLDPAGIDLQDGVPDAQRSLAFTGVRMGDAGAGDDSAAPVLRMLSPGADTTAVVRVRGEGGSADADEYTVPLKQGIPAEVSLGGLDKGFHDVEVTAESPIVGAVRQTEAAGAAADFAWMTPAPKISADVMFAVPSDLDAALHLLNDGDAAVTVTVADGDDEKRVEVPAHGSASAALRGGSTPVLSSSGPVRAALSAVGPAGTAQIAGWPLWPGDRTQQSITVYP